MKDIKVTFKSGSKRVFPQHYSKLSSLETEEPLEITRLRNTLKAWIVIATVATGFAVLLAFEVLELRDKLSGVL